MSHQCTYRVAKRQNGFVLIVALILLLVLTLLGLAAAQSSSLEERMAGNLRDSNLALQSAEAGLQAGIGCVKSGAADCMNFLSNTNGNYLFNPDAPPAPSTATTPLWQVPDFWENSSNYLGYTTLTGSSLPYVAAQPEIIIEEMPAVATPGGNLGATGYGSGSPTIQMVRITARGVGGDNAATALLQLIYVTN